MKLKNQGKKPEEEPIELMVEEAMLEAGKPEGCGEEFEYDIEMVLVCGEDNFKTGHIQLCPECSKPKNHSPQVDKDTPSGSRKELEGTFNLSKKRIRLNVDVKEDNDQKEGVVYDERDVKKFIKLLKERICVCVPHDKFPLICRDCIEIDKLAGDDLK